MHVIVEHSRKLSSQVFLTGLFCLSPFLVLEGLCLNSGTPYSWIEMLGRLLFTGSVLILAWLGQPRQNSQPNWYISRVGSIILFLGMIAGLIYGIWKTTWSAWLGLVIFFAMVIGCSRWLFGCIRKPWQVGLGVFLLSIIGLFPVIAGQLESRFSDEEFFVLLQAVGLVLYGWTLWLAKEQLEKLPIQLVRPKPFIRLPQRNYVFFGLVLAGGLITWATIVAYQHSFFPEEAPGYPGISDQQPYLCGSTAAVEGGVEGANIYQRLLERVFANPNKGVSEYALLALSTLDPAWLEYYRNAILEEAALGSFTGQAGSVKSVQYEASLRVYYYELMVENFPELFNSSEQAELKTWFAAINQRVMTVEWVDWLYALAFNKSPEGPYENQENGAGLLTLLESSGLAESNLSERNIAYLERQLRGWQWAFRVTDDAYVYQPEWIYNAWFQSQRTGINRLNASLSFDWLLLQALPDGRMPGYNHPYQGSLAGVAYLGAGILGDGRMLWLADRALSRLEAENGYLTAQPGMEQPLDLLSQSPLAGSCLIYGNSGLPNQPGPLAPDKLVFRDGWSMDARTLMINLRFSGWHRYKATNSLVLFYQGETLIQEQTEGQPFSWLPVGRSLFRDKRIPRENLNGLVVSRSGLGAVLYMLTGFGGRWAQDPPFYATVEQFSLTDEVDQSLSSINQWHRWDSWRQVSFYHEGPVVILDQARGPSGGAAALTWHIRSANSLNQNRIRLGTNTEPVEMLLVPYGDWFETESLRLQTEMNSPLHTIWVEAKDGELCLATLILSGTWVGAQAQVLTGSDGPALEIRAGDQRIVQPLNFDCPAGGD
jgi:hypothetical protein